MNEHLASKGRAQTAEVNLVAKGVQVSVYIIASSVAVGLPSLVSAIAKLVAVLRAKDITVHMRGRWR